MCSIWVLHETDIELYINLELATFCPTWLHISSPAESDGREALLPEKVGSGRRCEARTFITHPALGERNEAGRGAFYFSAYSDSYQVTTGSNV